MRRLSGQARSMKNLPLALFNYRDGGLRADGTYDFTSLITTFAENPNPAMIFLCGINPWHSPGRQPFLAAMKELSVLTGRPYVGELLPGTLRAAVVYDPTVFCLEVAQEPGRADARRGVEFHLRDELVYPLRVFVEHWPANTNWRLRRAKILARFGMDPVPTVIAGTLTGTSADEPRAVEANSTRGPSRAPAHHKHAYNAGEIGDTRGIELLIGTWQELTAKRSGGAGFRDIADLDLHPSQSSASTSEVLKGRRTDYILANQALLATADLLPGSYLVHDRHNATIDSLLSQHSRVSCTLRIHDRTR